MTLLKVEGVSLRFSAEQVLKDVSFELNDGQTLAVLGRSGSGKTTLLKIIAGLVKADEGRVWLKGRDITEQPPQDRSVVYLYQEPLLLPHLNLFENVAFGLRLRKETDIRERCDALIKALDLEEHRHKMPDQLSGGQRQRAAFGRAVVVRPNLLLLDEPFGALDVAIRANVQRVFRDIAIEFGIPALFVTHDLKEALLMGDCYGHMRDHQLVVFPDRRSFIADPAAGVPDEIDFWRGIGAE